jgi:hypothetical protein
MSRLPAPLLLLAVLVHGCTCGGDKRPTAGAAGDDAAGGADRDAGEGAKAEGGAPGRGASAADPSVFVATPPVFSAPIAATRVAHTAIVAGLVVADGVVRVASVGRAEGGDWTADALRGVGWSADEELHLAPAGDGVAVVWRGPSEGGLGRTLVVLGPAGEARGDPVEIGAAYCTTARGITWIEPHAGGAAQVRARTWADPTVVDVTTVAAERVPGLVCGDRAAYVLGDGDDDLTATAFVPGEGAPLPRVVALRDADFGDDEESEHRLYSMGDDLALVRVGGSGAVALREVPLGGAAAPWRRIRHALREADDVVAVDADPDATFLMYTHEAEDACPDLASGAASVRALRVERRSGAEARLDLAAPSCDVAMGPFWLAAAPGAPVVAWVERSTKTPARQPPITGVAMRSITGGEAHPSRIDLAADAVADAGCDDRGCALAALVRQEGDPEGRRPGPIRVISYP